LDSPSSSEYERAENDESGYESSGIDHDVSKKEDSDENGNENCANASKDDSIQNEKMLKKKPEIINVD